jgi:hypothetical protein
MRTNIIYDSIFTYDVEIVTHKGETNYYLIAPRTACRNWEVLRFSSIEDIIKEIKPNNPPKYSFQFAATNRQFECREAFASKVEYDMWMNRHIAELSETYCFAN